MIHSTQLRRPLSAGTLLGLGLLLAAPASPARAAEIYDAVGDFLTTYTGEQFPGLDVVAHEVIIQGDRLIFFGRMDGSIADTQAIGGLYLFGMDRGLGTPRLRNGTPTIGPNVLFDSVVRINPNGTGLVNNLVAGVVTQLDPADIHIDGDEFTASVPLSILLPASTRPPEEWTYNLWPRNGLVPGQNQHVSDLAPDDGNSPVQSLPDPGLPFQGRLAGSLALRTPLDPPFVFDEFHMAGNATQLGRFNLIIEATVNFGSIPPIGIGTYTFLAANGDVLVADFSGYSELVEPGLVLIVESGIIDPNSSTGRFAGTIGSFTVERLFDMTNGNTFGSFEGTISSTGANKR